ncbi:MAG: T9SS type A sorting domain-containing protein, partial [Rhodothermales bacterium]|nr:T9SS type A sorting domain-containing protein [Rhodothermales bacterium]
DQEQWYSLGRGVNSTVRALAMDQEGRVYAGGLFTRAGSMDARYVAVWDPAGFHWSNLGEGLSNMVRGIAVGPEGDVWVAGTFTKAGGMESIGVANWSPATGAWSPVDAGADATVTSLAWVRAKGQPNRLFTGGYFRRMGSEVSNHIGEWIPANATWTAAEAPTAVSLEVYPNPASNYLRIRLERPTEARLGLYDLLGRRVRAWEALRASETEISLQGLTSGVYVLRGTLGPSEYHRAITVIR